MKNKFQNFKKVTSYLILNKIHNITDKNLILKISLME